jgi:DNA helicase HerA-like ATPase
MSTSFSEAVDALTAQARSLVEAASGEIDALREELEQERRFRRHLEATAASRAQEWAALQEEGRQQRERLEAELAEAREGRRLAEAEVERFHEAVREQLAIAEREQAALEEAERERERLRKAQLEQHLQEAAEAAARREAELQEAFEGQRQVLLQDLAQEQRARQRLERRLGGVRQAVLDLLAPQGNEEEATAAGSEEYGLGLDGCGEFTDGTGRMALRKILVPRQAGPISQQALP